MNTAAFRGYEILETLPKGGMSTVYKARQVSLDRLVAIKVLPPAMGVDPADIEKFMAEARITASLKHANIVQVYDFGKSEDGAYYIVMEYISGYTVSAWIRRKRCLSEDNALLCGLNVALAMNYAWQKAGIVHCDIKPDNVIIDGDGTVKLADLGLARSVKSIVSQAQPEEHLIFGTPNYISPEQSSDVKPLDCRADIYSLGAMLYHCLTGTMPFEGRAPAEVMDLQISDQISDPQDINPRVSVQAACLIEKMMAKDRYFRPKDWDEVIKDISSVRSEIMPQGCLPPEVVSTIKRSPQRDTRLQEVLQTPETEEKKTARRPPLADIPVKTHPPGTDSRRKYLPAAAAAVLALAAVWALHAFLSHKIKTERTGRAPENQLREAAPREVTAKAALTAGEHRLENAEPARSQALKAECRAVETRALLAQLDKKAGVLSARGRFAEAAAVYEKYRGAFENETLAERQKKTQALKARQAAALAKERQKHEKQAELQLQHAAGEIAVIIAEDDLAAARARLPELAADLPLLAGRPEFKNLATLLETASRAEQKIVDSFRAQKNQSLAVAFVAGPTNVFVRDVQDDLVIAERTIALEQGTLSIQKNFRVRDLALDEKFARLGVKPEQEIALMRTILALESGECRQALAAAAQTGPLLAAPLAAALKNAAENRATQSLAAILRRAGVGGDNYQVPAPDACRQCLSGRKFSRKKSQELNRGVALFRVRFGFTDMARRYEDVLLCLTNADLRLGETAPPAPEAVKTSVPQAQAGQAPDDTIILKMVEANPGLRAEEVVLERDAAGRFRAVEIVSSNLRDLKPLASLATLRTLVCSGMRQNIWVSEPIVAPLDDLTPLEKMPLEELILNNTRVKDLTPLSQMPLARLNLAHTKTGDLQPLKGLRLRSLDLSFTAVRDLQPLAGMPLQHLNITGTDIADLQPLAGAPLNALYAGFTRIRDLRALASLRLARLAVQHTAVNDIAPLRDMPLEYLNLSDTRIRDITALGGLPLKMLEIHNNNIGDIAVLRGMPLVRLNLSNTRVKDLTPLAGMPLQSLNLEKSNVKDISALKNVPLKSLRLRETAVVDLTPLEDSGIEEIWIDDLRGQLNKEKSRLLLEAMYKMPKLKTINGRPLWMFRADD